MPIAPAVFRYPNRGPIDSRRFRLGRAFGRGRRIIVDSGDHLTKLVHDSAPLKVVRVGLLRIREKLVVEDDPRMALA